MQHDFLMYVAAATFSKLRNKHTNTHPPFINN